MHPIKVCSARGPMVHCPFVIAAGQRGNISKEKLA